MSSTDNPPGELFSPEIIQDLIYGALHIIITMVVPTLLQLLRRYHLKEAYHTSVLTGHGWVMELLNGHPDRIRTELGVHKHVFHRLISKLRDMGYTDSRYVTLEEQLAIFLHTCVTGGTVRHEGERFQRANATIAQ